MSLRPGLESSPTRQPARRASVELTEKARPSFTAVRPNSVFDEIGVEAAGISFVKLGHNSTYDVRRSRVHGCNFSLTHNLIGS